MEKELPVKENKSVFNDIDKLISNEFDDLIDLNKVDTKVKTWFDTGIYALNYSCSKNLFGGIPIGRITSIDGLSGTGKSLILASIMKDPKIDYTILIESEGGGSSAELYEFAGVDMSKMRMLKANTFENYRISKKDTSIEEVSDNKFPKTKDTKDFLYKEGVTRIVKKIINTIQFNNVKKNILVILDTLGNLQSVRELSGTPDMGSRSKAVSTFFRNFDISFENTNIAFVFANKLYTNIGNQWDPYKVSGGVNVEYNPSLNIRLADTSETDDVSDTEMKVEKERRKSALGSSIKTIKATIKKSRFGTELRNCRFIIDFSVGPVKYSGLFGLCKDFGIMERKGSSYTILGLFEDKSFYKKNFIKNIMENEEENLNKLQTLLEKAETEILLKSKNLQVNDESDIIDEEDITEEDYSEMKKQMIREIEN